MLDSSHFFHNQLSAENTFDHPRFAATKTRDDEIGRLDNAVSSHMPGQLCEILEPVSFPIAWVIKGTARSWKRHIRDLVGNPQGYTSITEVRGGIPASGWTESHFRPKCTSRLGWLSFDASKLLLGSNKP